jgi:hypothetical protein
MKRPTAQELAEARARCAAVLDDETNPLPDDVATLLAATEPFSNLEIDRLVDDLRIDQFSAERVLHRILGRK